MTAHDRAEDDEGSSNSECVLHQREKTLEVLYTSKKMQFAMEKDIQTKMFQQRSILDEEIDELWNLGPIVVS